jgi:16S rRNA (cytosine1402-N4)-methyltransferase
MSLGPKAHGVGEPNPGETPGARGRQADGARTPQGSRTPPGFSHIPVMLAEVLELFAPVPDGTLLDATVGGGGHASSLLQASPTRRLVGLDRDPEAVAVARTALQPFAGRASVRKARFADLDAVLHDLGVGELSGALFDLGVSSAQLDRPERGFSYRFDAPLDMRMDQSEGETAAELVNQAPAERLAELFTLHGEAGFARRIAAAVVAARPLRTTLELSEVVSSAVPAAARRRGHPAKRVFQALRAAVNSELEQLPVALDAALGRLAPGGRLVVISYHSGEDRLVKRCLFDAATGGCTCPPSLPCVCGAVPRVRLLTRGARKPSASEIATNPRAASARLRAAEALGVEAREQGGPR